VIWPGVSGSPPLLAPRRLTPRGVPPIPQPRAVQNIGNLPGGHWSHRMPTLAHASLVPASHRQLCKSPLATPPSSSASHRQLSESPASAPLARPGRPPSCRSATVSCPNPLASPTASHRQLCESAGRDPVVPGGHRLSCANPPPSSTPPSLVTGAHVILSRRVHVVHIELVAR